MDPDYIFYYEENMGDVRLIQKLLEQRRVIHWYEIEVELASKAKQIRGQNSLKLCPMNKPIQLFQTNIHGYAVAPDLPVEFRERILLEMGVHGYTNFSYIRKVIWDETLEKHWLDIELHLQPEGVIGIISFKF